MLKLEGPNCEAAPMVLRIPYPERPTVYENFILSD